MALFQPIQSGPSGSAVTPKAEVQDTTVSSALNIASNIGTSLAGVFQQQTEAKNKQAIGVAMTAFVEEQSRIAEAAEQGLITPAEAHTRMRAVVNKHAANNPMLLNPILETQKAYADSQMGKSVDLGSVEYQKKQALDMQLSKEALSAGFVNTQDYLNFKQDQVEWKRNDERRTQALFLANMEKTRAQTDAAKQSAANSKIQRLQAEEKQHANEGLRTDLANLVPAMQNGLQVIRSSPLTVENQIIQIKNQVAQWKAQGTSTYNKAEQGNLNMYIATLDTLEKNAIDAVTKGTLSSVAKNNLNMLQDKAMITVLSHGKNALTAATINAFGEAFYNDIPPEQILEIGKTVSLVEMPVDVAGDYKKFNTGNFEDFFRSANAQSKNMGSTGTPEADKQNMQNQTNNLLETISIHGAMSTVKEKEAGIKAVTGAYEMLKTAGEFDIQPETRGRFQEFMSSNFKGIYADIKANYLDAVDMAYSEAKRGTGYSAEVKVEARAATEVIKPVIEGGVFKFVGTDKASQAAANRLNEKTASGINTLLKLIAVTNGNPDLNKAMEELAPRLFEERVPGGE